MLAASTLAARWLGAGAYGAFATALTVAGLLGVALQLGLPGLLLRHLGHARTAAAQRDDGRSLYVALRRVLLAGGGVGLVALGAIGLAAWHGGSGVVTSIAYGGAAAVPLALLRVVDAWHQARGAPIHGHLGDAVLRPVALIAAIAGGAVLVRMPSRELAAALPVLAFAAASLACLVPLAGRLHAASRAPGAATFSPWQAGLPLMLAGVLHAVMAGTDVLMLNAIAGDAAAGIYHIASRAALVLGLVLSAVNTVLGPRMAALAAAGDRDGLSRVAATSARSLAIPVLLATPLVAAGAPAALATLCGPAFAAGGPALSLLWLGQFVNLACGPVAVVLNLHDRARVALRAVAIGAAANVTLNALLIPVYGLPGAAAATALGTTLWNVLLAHDLRRGLGIDPTILGRAPIGKGV